MRQGAYPRNFPTLSLAMGRAGKLDFPLEGKNYNITPLRLKPLLYFRIESGWTDEGSIGLSGRFWFHVPQGGARQPPRGPKMSLT